jgi:hypothetical protein
MLRTGSTATALGLLLAPKEIVAGNGHVTELEGMHSRKKVLPLVSVVHGGCPAIGAHGGKIVPLVSKGSVVVVTGPVAVEAFAYAGSTAMLLNAVPGAVTSRELVTVNGNWPPIAGATGILPVSLRGSAVVGAGKLTADPLKFTPTIGAPSGPK